MLSVMVPQEGNDTDPDLGGRNFRTEPVEVFADGKAAGTSGFLTLGAAGKRIPYPGVSGGDPM